MTREPEWDAEERAWVLGLALREHAECRRCGGVLAETTDPQWVWRAQPPVECMKCTAIALDQAKYHDKHNAPGLIHVVTKAPNPRKRGGRHVDADDRGPAPPADG